MSASANWNQAWTAARVSGNRTCWRCGASWSYSTRAELELAHEAAGAHRKAHRDADAEALASPIKTGEPGD